MAKKRISPLPKVPPDANPSVRKWMETVKEAVEVRLGRRGDPNEAAITFNDLIDAGIIQSLGKLNADGTPIIYPPPPDGGGDYIATPVAPANFTVLGVFGGVHILWDTPSWRYQVTVTEIRRGTTPDLELADLIGSSGGSSYFDIISDGGEVAYWYWARHINSSGTPGPWTLAAEGVKPANVDVILEELTGKITETELALDLNHRIDLIDAPSTEPGSVNARIATLQTQVETEDLALSQEIDQVYVTMDDNIAAVEQNVETEIIRVDGEIESIKALYSVSVNANGVAGGFYIAATDQVVQAVWDVDRFAIGRVTGQDDVFPFIYDSGLGAIVMDTVMIKDASIQEAKIGPITIGKITKNNGTPITTVGGLIRADAIDVNNLHVAEAATFTGVAQSDNYQPGVRGWRLTPNGFAEFGSDANIDYEILGGRKPHEMQSKNVEVTASSGEFYSFPLAHCETTGLARFRVWTEVGGGHNLVEFTLSAAHGRGDQATCTIHSASRYGGLVLRQIRLYYNGTNDPMYAIITINRTVLTGDIIRVEIDNSVGRGDGWELDGGQFHNVPSGSSARIWEIDYDRVSDDTKYNTSFDTSRVAGTSASTVRNRANNGNSAYSRVFNNWTRPGTTLINGNEIFTGDAYVDTLQIKGQAVTFPRSSYTSGTTTTGASSSWRNIEGLFVDGSDPKMVTCSAVIANNVGNNVAIDLRVTIGGNQVYYAPGCIEPQSVVFVSADFRTTRSGSIWFQMRGRGNPINGDFVYKNRSITCTNMKR